MTHALWVTRRDDSSPRSSHSQPTSKEERETISQAIHQPRLMVRLSGPRPIRLAEASQLARMAVVQPAREKENGLACLRGVAQHRTHPPPRPRPHTHYILSTECADIDC